jgi:16S rRNA C967 or C1407 C5-methylase (RsmB/RsmF family)
VVATGGVLVYATCSLNRGENDEIVSRFERRYVTNKESTREDERSLEGIRFEPSPLYEDDAWGQDIVQSVGSVGSATAHTQTLFPHIHGTDGFFVARWRRSR